MPDKTQRDTINEVHQAVLGVRGTADKGMVGDLKGLKDYVEEQAEVQNTRMAKIDSRVTKLEISVASGAAALLVTGTLQGVGVIHLFG